MPVPVVVIRPEPGCGATCARARALGLEAIGVPLFAVRPLAWEPVPREAIDALLLGSANALRHGGEAIALYRGQPAYVVGEATAAAARRAGLDVRAIGAGGLRSVLDALAPAHRRLLRLAGRERVDLPPLENVSIVTRETYASEALPLPRQLAARLAEPAVVLLHSAEAALHFARCCDDAAIGRARLALATIGPRVSAGAGSGWRTVASAAEPTDAALLALAKEMCHTLGRD